ncbi:MAG TPA: ATP-dependent helicase [Blastocatellia bacterium]|nr:ATP-dependent helicase [Blastocatellia bacterium]
MSKKYVIKRDVPRRFLVNYKADLNAEQYDVVTAGGGPILVIAGAGSGKTRAVTYRVSRLVESGVSPARILLVTFTNKAAREMLRRVEGLVQADVRRIWGGTFHSIANRVLRRHAESVGYQPNFTILDSEDSKDLIESSIQESGVDVKARRFPKAEVLADLISFANNRDMMIRDCIVQNYPHFEPLATQIERVDRIYQARKLERNTMDYDDLLMNWKRLLTEKEEISRYWADLFEHILVDEYQDTNKIQAEIVDLLAVGHRNVMVVGDDAQSIFGWRGAHFANIYTFKERYPDAQEYRLETNYRSRPEIILLANASIRNNRRQFPKNLQAARESAGGSPAVIPLRDAEQQAAFVAGRVLELRDEGVPLSEIAVLYRSHWHALELQLELVRRDIPYVIRSGVRFFEQAHIKDVISYLRLIVNPHDELAWKRVLKLIPKVGNATANRIWERIAVTSEPLALVRRADFDARPRASEAWWDFIRLIEQLISPENLDRPASQVALILASGYEEHLQNTYENADLRAEDLRQLSNFAARFDSTEAFLSELALVNTERFGAPQGTTAEDVVMGGDEDEKLVLSSVHQAKGLEWREVFLIWAADGKFPSARSLRDAESEEEERRLFYVAITRAKDELYLCYPLVVTDWSRQTVIQKPSRFITEVPRELCEIWSVEEEEMLEEGEDEKPRLIN